MNEIKEKLDNLHSKILRSPFAKNVTESEIIALIESKKVVEKQIPKKPLHNGANWYRCPNGCEVHKKQFEKDWYCPMCGQAILWEGVNEHDGE